MGSEKGLPLTIIADQYGLDSECDQKGKGGTTLEKKDRKRKGEVIKSEKEDKRRKEDELDYWKRKYSYLKERFKRLGRGDVRNEKLQQKIDDGQNRNSLVYSSFKKKEAECRELEDKLSDSAKIREYKKMCSEMQDKIVKLEEKSIVIESGTATEQIAHLKAQAKNRLKYELNLEEKYNVLCMKYKQKKEKVISLENEVKESKGVCAQLSERIVSLEKDQKAAREREKRAQARIRYLEKSLGKKKMKSEKKLQHQGLDEENPTLRCSAGTRGYGVRECAQRGAQQGSHNESFRNDEVVVAPSTFEEKMRNSAEKYPTSAFQDNNNSSQGNQDAHVSVIPKLKLAPINVCAWTSSDVALSGGRNVEESVSPSLQRQVSLRKCEEKKNGAYETLENAKDILAPNNLEMSVSSAHVKIGNLTSENDEEKVAQEAGSESKGDSMGGNLANGVDGGDSSSDSKDAVDNELDFGQDKAMMLKNVGFSSSVALSSGGQNVEESVSPSSQRQVSPRKCKEKKNGADEKLKHVKDILTPNNLEMFVSSAQVKISDLTSENDEEKVAREAGCESEGDSMGGRLAKGVDVVDISSDSEDAVDNELDFGQDTAMGSNADKEMKWQNEADMVSSFEKDPVLCMEAVCALHRQQADNDKLIKAPFSLFSALSGSDLAGFLMDGKPGGKLKKSVVELEMSDPEGLEDCKTLAKHYSNQLFSIYQNEEDPFFNSSLLLTTRL